MKNCYLLALLSLLYACASPTQQNSPEEAARHFFEELSQANFEIAAQYGTDKTQKSLRLIQTELKMSNPTEQATIKTSLKLQFQTVKCTELNGQTTCQLCCGADSSEAVVEMVQKDKKWFVHWER